MQEAKRNEASILALIALITLGAGYLYISPAFNATDYPPPYLQDPEEEPVEWEDYVWADNAQQAQRRCQQLADNNGVALAEVKQAGRNRWRCKFSG